MTDEHWFDALNKALIEYIPRRTLLGAATALLTSFGVEDARIAEAARKRKRKRKKKSKKSRKKGNRKRQRPPCPGEPCLILGTSPGCCDPGLKCCDGLCVDLNSDDRHCNGCNQRCSPGKLCFGGTCVCQEGLTLCGEICRDTSRDENNCGQCGNQCPPGLGCIAGSCEEPCGGTCDGPNLECCPVPGSSTWECVTTNCGSCDEPCTGLFKNCCDGACTDTRFDNNHCGDCLPCADGWECCHGACIDPRSTKCCRNSTYPDGRGWCGINADCCTENGQTSCCNP